MSRRAHHRPKPYRPKPARTWEHYRRPPDDGEQELLARAYGLWQHTRENDQ